MSLRTPPDPRSPLRLGLWAVLIVGIFAWAPALYPGYWQPLEGYRPVFNVGQPAALSSVAADPDVWRGTGRAAFLPAQPLLALGMSPTAAVRMLFVAALLLGGLGVYVWMRVHLSDRAAGLAGLLYMLWPPLLTTVYMRGSVSDAWIMALLPLALAGLAVFVANRSPSSAGVTVLAVLWMWRTQAGLALFATLLLIAYALIAERSRTGALIPAVSGLAGLTSLIPLLDVQSPATVVFADHFIHPSQLLYSGAQAALDAASSQEGDPFSPGFAVVALGGAALWFWWRAGSSVWARQLRNAVPPRFVFSALGFALLTLLLALPISSSLWLWSSADRLLTYPWQVALLAGPFLAAVGGLLPALNESLAEPVYWSVLVTLVVLSSYPFLRADYTRILPPAAPVAVVGNRQEVVILEMQLEEDAQARTAELDVTWQSLSTPAFDYSIFFQALPAESETVIAQLDTQPLYDERPATSWRPGEIFTATYRLDLSTIESEEQAEPGKGAPVPGRDGLRYYFGYYDWRDGARLPLSSGLDDKIILYGE